MIANTIEGELIIMQIHSNIVRVCVFVCVSGGWGGGGVAELMKKMKNRR